ncbi:hypothetical protein GIB67_012843 [Kingdonia uniflora]|uniref:Uncharacterized protein n=1 Tax=Kingdonia uniflora TaxID=39325 RepID=A0A7J7NFI1_9MAGN|nr:hypothetical protein GIB67_012843 [Kingdonia uniflora]
MGISKLIGLKATVMLMAFYSLRKSGFLLISIPFLHASVVAFLVSIASHPFINLPLLLGKTSDGKFPLWSKIIFGPFLYFVRSFATLRRLYSREPPYNEVCEGVYVGGWPSSLDKLPPGNPAVIDCTAELPRTEVVKNNAYLCVPTWDTRSPQPSEIESAVRWACRMRARKLPIFIHCAYGNEKKLNVFAIVPHEFTSDSLNSTHNNDTDIANVDTPPKYVFPELGEEYADTTFCTSNDEYPITDTRSGNHIPFYSNSSRVATPVLYSLVLINSPYLPNYHVTERDGHGRSVVVLCALLVALGVAGDWKDAERITRERRPSIRMNSLHRKNLEKWSKHRFVSTRTTEGMNVSSLILPNSSENPRSR